MMTIEEQQLILIAVDALNEIARLLVGSNPGSTQEKAYLLAEKTIMNVMGKL